MPPNTIGQPELATQNRVISLFRDELHYDYLGDWTDRPNNSNIEEGLLTAYLNKSGYSRAQISRALDKLRTEAGNHNRNLYENNKAVYSLLRYGVQVQVSIPTNSARRWRTRLCSTWSMRRATSTSTWARKSASTPGSTPRPKD